MDIKDEHFTRADYSKIASFYDQGRTHSDSNMSIWLDLIKKHTQGKPGIKVLDLGCGTGRFSLPMAKKLRFSVTGVDASVEMLEKAKQKDPESQIEWMISDAQSLLLPNNTFELVFVSHLLHHVDDPLLVLKESSRVLSSSGRILILGGTIEQICDDVEHTFFPETVEIDERRTPSKEQVKSWLLEADFSEISSEEVIQKTYESGEERLNSCKVKKTSVLTMIPEESFQTGMSRLAEYIEKHPDDEWLLFDKLTITVAKKSNQ